MAEFNLENWPEGFYRLGEIKEREQALKEALEAGLEPSDSARRLLFYKRYQPYGKKNELQDRFMYSFMMLQALSENGYVFPNPMRKKLHGYFQELMLEDYKIMPALEKELLEAEWRQMAGLYISTCVGNKNYGAVLSLIPIGQEQRGRKMMEGIKKALVTFPQSLGMENLSAPLYQIFENLYEQITANAKS